MTRGAGWSRAALVTAIVIAVPLGYIAATRPIDVAIYRDIGRQVLRGDYQLYSADVSLGFRYAPIVAFLFVPLAWVPFWAAALAIYALKLVTLAATIVIIARLAGLDREQAAKTGLLALLVTSGYVLEEFRTGNVHFLMLFVIVTAMYLAERGRLVVPSLLIALAAAVKISPLIFVGLFLATRRYLLAAVTCIALAGMLLLPAAIVGVSTNTELLRGFARSATERAEEARNHSLKGVLTRVLSDEGPDAGVLPAVNVARLSASAVEVVWYAGEAATIAALGWILMAARRRRESPLLEYSLVTTAMLILSPYSLRIYFATLFLPCAALLAALLKSPSLPHRRVIVAILLAATFASTLMPLIPGRRWSLLFEALSPHFLVSVAVAAALAWLLLKPASSMPRSA